MGTTQGEQSVPVPAGADAPDGPGLALGIALAIQKMDTVATIAALPSAGNWPGRVVRVRALPGALFWSDGTTVWTMYGTAYVASAAARSTAIPAPVAGMKTQRADCTWEERYNGTSWMPVSALVPIIPTVSGSNVSVSPGGRITAAASTGFAILNAFSASFDNYLLKAPDGVWSLSGQWWALALGNGGVGPGSGHDAERLTGTGASAGAASTGSNAATIQWPVANGYVNQWADIDIYSPALAKPTRFLFEASEADGAGNVATIHVGGFERASTSFTDLVFTKATGVAATFTGTFELYGFNNNI